MPELFDDDFVINVEKGGVAISAKGEKELREGFFTILDRIKLDDDNDGSLCLDLETIRERAKVSVCMAHFCVFPETELYELRRFIRFCASLRYTHVIIEFWGTLKYDCMKELSWESAYTKEQIRPIFDEARDLGVNLVPMFNHWGHAAGSRARHGKHVVLDQNPALQSYFSDDGWCWDIKKPKVRALFSEIRRELSELFYDSEYFHVGCDEAYGFDLNLPGAAEFITDYLNETNQSITKSGKKMICWGDMFLCKNPDYNPQNKYECNCPSEEIQSMLLDRLDKEIIIADWQYNVSVYPIETSMLLKNKGFKVLVCPWDSSLANVNSCVETAKDYELFGVVQTTWHTLSVGTPMVTVMALGCYYDTSKLLYGKRTVMTSAQLRKVYPVGGDYSKAGWSKKQIDDITG